MYLVSFVIDNLAKRHEIFRTHLEVLSFVTEQEILEPASYHYEAPAVYIHSNRNLRICGKNN
jgi:hypothetical protein